MKDLVSNTANLMNFELQGSNSNNYGVDQTSSSPQSFPAQMENGILVKYENVVFSSELIEESSEPKEDKIPTE